MMKLFGLVLLLIKFSSSCGGRHNGEGPSTSPSQHYTNLIVGGGPAGLYNAWRLSGQPKNEKTAIFEWSPKRLGGRVFTKTFPGGQFLELGAWRFTTQHVLLQQVLRQLNLSTHITDFPTTNNRLYYVRGRHIYQKEISKKGMPYNTIHRRDEPDSLFDEIGKKLHPSNETSRAEWCTFFDEGVFPANVSSNAFRKNDILGNIGYHNLIVDQLGNEGFSYASDTAGFTSHILNSNAACSIFSNEDFKASTKYLRLRTGYSTLIKALEKECVKKHVEINLGQRLTEFYWNADERKFYSTFMRYSGNGKPCKKTLRVTSDRLFLSMPPRSLELIREMDVVGDNWPANKERRVLKHSPGEFYIDSVIKQPAYKVGLIYNHPWWLNATYKPHLRDSPMEQYDIAPMYNHGPTVTDLPLRMIFYFGNNKEIHKRENMHYDFGNNEEINKGEPVYGIMATYSDMRNRYFWSELELSPDEGLRPNHPSFLQPLFPGTEITDVMHRVLREQLNKVHYGNSRNLQVPPAIKGSFMNWGCDPFGAGYHTWKAHYKIGEAQYYMTRPSEAIGMEVPVHVAGEAYAYDQSWIEGAFATAETILVEKYGLKPLLPADYLLICRPKHVGKK